MFFFILFLSISFFFFFFKSQNPREKEQMCVYLCFFLVGCAEDLFYLKFNGAAFAGVSAVVVAASNKAGKCLKSK